MPSDWRISAPAPLRDHQGHHAQDEGEGGHQDRPQTGAGRFHRGVEPAHPLVLAPAWRTRRSGSRSWRPGRPARRSRPAPGYRPPCPGSASPVTAASRHIGTIRITASGSVQLSYCAASSRKTKTTDSRRRSARCRPPDVSWNASSVHSKPKPSGSFSAAMRSIASSAEAGRVARQGGALDLRRGVEVVAGARGRGRWCRGSSATEPIGTISPASLRVFRLAMSLGSSRNVPSAWAVTR